MKRVLSGLQKVKQKYNAKKEAQGNARSENYGGKQMLLTDRRTKEKHTFRRQQE